MRSQRFAADWVRSTADRAGLQTLAAEEEDGQSDDARQRKNNNNKKNKTKTNKQTKENPVFVFSFFTNAPSLPKNKVLI